MEKKMFTVTLEVEAAREESVAAMLSRTLDDHRVLSFAITPEDKKKKARISYDKEQDEYKLMLSTDGGDTWDFCTGCICQRCENDKPDKEPMYVHVGLIEEMKKAIRCGFSVTY